jgi:hypothetical protein
MRKFSLIAVAVLAGTVLTGLFSAPAWAQSPRTYVSSVVTPGSGPTGSCTIQVPCNSISQALGLTSSGGEVIVVATGSYAPVIITQSVTIETAPGVYAGITPVGSGAGVTVRATADANVVLRGLTIQSVQFEVGGGIEFASGAALSVENCVLDGGLYGIYQPSAGRLFVSDTLITNYSTGVFADGTGPDSLSHVWLENNIGYGLLGGGPITISNSVISGNYGGGGIATDETTGEINIESCQISNNYEGIESSEGTVRVSNSTVTDNINGGLVQDGGVFDSRQNNTVAGNHPDASGTITPLSPM